MSVPDVRHLRSPLTRVVDDGDPIGDLVRQLVRGATPARDVAEPFAKSERPECLVEAYREFCQHESDPFHAVDDHDWIGPSNPAPQRLALDTPDDIECQEPRDDDGLGPATGVIVGLTLIVGFISGLWAAWTIATELGLI